MREQGKATTAIRPPATTKVSRGPSSVPARPPITIATSELPRTTLQHLRDEFRRWAAVEHQQATVWRDAAGISRSHLWLTEDEVAELSADLRAVMKKYTGDRDAVHHPEGTRRVFCLFAIVPEAY